VWLSFETHKPWIAVTEPHYNELSGVKRQLFLVLAADEQEMRRDLSQKQQLNMYFQWLDHYQIEPDYIWLHENFIDFKTLLCPRQYSKALTSGAAPAPNLLGFLSVEEKKEKFSIHIYSMLKYFKRFNTPIPQYYYTDTSCALSLFILRVYRRMRCL